MAKYSLNINGKSLQVDVDPFRNKHGMFFSHALVMMKASDWRKESQRKRL
jgi:hypothetical protein